MRSYPRSGATPDLRRYLLLGAATTLILTAGIGGWAATTELAGAVVAPAVLVVDSNVKKVQHPTGGVVSELRVHDGDPVRAGDLLVRLDETVTRANLAVVEKQLVELAARRARDEAERDGAPSVTFPADLLARSGDDETQAVLRGEERLFAIRRSAREGQRAQLKERIGQFKEEIRGLTEQVKAKEAELELIQQELAGVRDLWEKHLVPIMRLTSLQRDAARLGGEHGSLLASIAQAKGRISETELQILQIDQDLRTEVGKDLAEIRARSSELVERRIAAEDQLKRVDIRAPQDGIVEQSTVHTVGGVVTAGDTIMIVVPQTDDLQVEAKVNPADIDKLQVGQKTLLRLSAFNQRTTPELNGVVSRVSPDVTTEQRSGQSYYTIRVSMPPEEIARLGDVKLIPGMPVEAFVQTGDRTMMSYLMKPLHDQLMRAFRER
jgi:HlyD family secretion protein